MISDITSPEYAKAFKSYLLGNERAEASLQTDSAADGGYLAPPQFVAELVRELGTGYWFRGLANVLPATTAPKVTRPRRTSRPDPMAWTTELATPAVDAGLKLGNYQLTPHYQSCEFEVSSDLLRAAPNAAAVLAEEIDLRAGDGEEAGFLTGNGAGQPLGLFTPDSNGVGTDRDIAVDITDFSAFRKARFGLKAPYLRSPSLRWVLHPNAGKLLAGLKGSNGQPLWCTDNPDQLDGVAIAWSDNAPAGTGAGNTYQSGDTFGLIGDLKFYDVLDGLAVTITRLTDAGYTRRNMTGFVVRRKVDGAPRVSEAFTRLKAS